MSKSGSKLSQQLNETYKLDFYYAFIVQDKVAMLLILIWYIWKYTNKEKLSFKMHQFLINNHIFLIFEREWLLSDKLEDDLLIDLRVVKLMNVIWNEYVQKTFYVLHGKRRRLIWPQVDRCNLSSEKGRLPMHLKSNFLLNLSDDKWNITKKILWWNISNISWQFLSNLEINSKMFYLE